MYMFALRLKAISWPSIIIDRYPIARMEKFILISKVQEHPILYDISKKEHRSRANKSKFEILSGAILK